MDSSPPRDWEAQAESLLQAYFDSVRPRHFPPIAPRIAPTPSRTVSKRWSALSRSRMVLLGGLVIVVGLWLLLGPLGKAPRRVAVPWNGAMEARQEKPHESSRSSRSGP